MSCNYVMKITAEEQKAIRKSYDRTDKEIDEDIQHLKDWLKKQPHLPQDEDETRLRKMLYNNKFSLEKTKNKLDMYYSLKHFVPEFYVDREPSNPQISNQMDHLVLMPLPNLTGDLNRIILSKLSDSAPTNFDIYLYTKIIFGMMDLITMYDSKLADQIIIDFEYVKFGHVVQSTPVIGKKIVTLLQKSYSHKIKGFHFINVPHFAQKLVSFLSSALSEKLAARIQIHTNYDSLKETLSPNALPNDFGGTAGPLNELYDNWRKYYKSQNDWLKELGDKKSDESKRVGQPIDSDMFGMCGSFRKLNYD